MNKPMTCLCAVAVVLALNPIPDAVAAPGKHSVKQLSLNKTMTKQKSRNKRKRRAVFTCDQYSRKTLLRKSRRFSKTINHASRQYGVSKNLIRAVIAVESCFNPRARGGLGEKGLMQLMPGTARELGVKNGFSPWQNIHGGTKYLKRLLVRYKGNKRYAVAAYNGGPGAVSKRYGPKFKQVKRYSKHVMRAYKTLNRGQSYEAPSRFKKVSTKKLKPKRSNVSKKKQKARFTKKRYKKTYQAKRYKRSKQAKRYQKKTKRSVRRTRTHYVKSGQTLYSIARAHRTTVKKLKRLNRLRSNLIRSGTRIRVR